MFGSYLSVANSSSEQKQKDHLRALQEFMSVLPEERIENATFGEVLIQLKDDLQWRKGTFWKFDPRKGDHEEWRKGIFWIFNPRHGNFEALSFMKFFETEKLDLEGKIYSFHRESNHFYLVSSSPLDRAEDKILRGIKAMAIPIENVQRSPGYIYIEYGDGEIKFRKNQYNYTPSKKPIRIFVINGGFDTRIVTEFILSDGEPIIRLDVEMHGLKKEEAEKRGFIIDTHDIRTVFDQEGNRIYQAFRVIKTVNGGKENILTKKESEDIFERFTKKAWHISQEIPQLRKAMIGLSPTTTYLSPRELQIFGPPKEMLAHPDFNYRNFILKTVMGFGPQTLLFYAAVGALSFRKSLTQEWSGAQDDPLWWSHFLQEVTSPLGLTSFMAFLIASGTVHGLTLWRMNDNVFKLETKQAENRKKVEEIAKRQQKLASSNVSTHLLRQQWASLEKQRHSLSNQFEKFQKEKFRNIKWLQVATMPAALSAGVMLSTAIHEFWSDPNLNTCREGMEDPNNRKFNFLQACDQAYADWVIGSKLKQWAPDMVGIVLAAGLSHFALNRIAFGLSLNKYGKDILSAGRRLGPIPYVFLSLYTFMEVHHNVINPVIQWVRQKIFLKNKIESTQNEAVQFIQDLHKKKIIDHHPEKRCVISKSPEEMSKDEVMEYLSSRDLSWMDEWLSMASWSRKLTALDKTDFDCRNRDLIYTLDNQFNASSKLTQATLINFYMAQYNWTNLSNRAFNSYGEVKNFFEIMKQEYEKTDESENVCERLKKEYGSTAEVEEFCEIMKQEADGFSLLSPRHLYGIRFTKSSELNNSDPCLKNQGINEKIHKYGSSHVDFKQLENTLKQAHLCINSLKNANNVQKKDVSELISETHGEFLKSDYDFSDHQQILNDIQLLISPECQLSEEREEECRWDEEDLKSIATGVELLNKSIERAQPSAGAHAEVKKLIKEERGQLEWIKKVIGISAQPLPDGVHQEDAKIKTELLPQLHEESHSWFPSAFDGYSEDQTKEMVRDMVCGKEISSSNTTSQWSLFKEEEEYYIFTMPKIVVENDQVHDEICHLKTEKAYNSQITVGEKTYNNLLEYVLAHIDPGKMNDTWWTDHVESQFSSFANFINADYQKIIEKHLEPSIQDVFSNASKEFKNLSNLLKEIHSDSLNEHVQVETSCPTSKTAIINSINDLSVAFEEQEDTLNEANSGEEITKGRVKKQDKFIEEQGKAIQCSLLLIDSYNEEEINEEDEILGCLHINAVCNFTLFSLREQASIAVYRRMQSVLEGLKILQKSDQVILNLKENAVRFL